MNTSVFKKYLLLTNNMKSKVNRNNVKGKAKSNGLILPYYLSYGGRAC